MSTKTKNSIAEQLKTADVRINNSISNEDVKVEVTKMGYGLEKLTEGKELLENAKLAVRDAVSLEGEAKNATENESKRRKEAEDAYQDFAKVCRARFQKDQSKLDMLGLTGKQPQSTAEFIKAGYTLFGNAIDIQEILIVVSENGYTAEKLAADKAKIEAYENANKEQVSAKGASETATFEQNKALKKLNEWVSEYTKIAKVALRNNPKLLDKLGISLGNQRKGKKKVKEAAQQA